MMDLLFNCNNEQPTIWLVNDTFSIPFFSCVVFVIFVVVVVNFDKIINRRSMAPLLISREFYSHRGEFNTCFLH